MRRTAGLAFLSLLVAACGAAPARSLVDYHDPGGRFVASLPAANTFTVVPTRLETASTPGVLAGVIAEPPALASPSASPTSAIGGFGIGPTSDDRTIFQALVVTTDGFTSLDDMTLYFLTNDSTFDVRETRAIRVAGEPGRLVVADYRAGDAATAGVAGAFTLGRDGVGYLIAAIFPPGTWAAQRADFLAVVRSFRSAVPPQEAAIPVAVPTAA